MAAPTRQPGSDDRVALESAGGFLICIGSVIAGGGFGALATFGMGLGIMAPIGAFFGVAAGLLLSPFPLWALGSGRFALGASVIMIPTAATAYIGGLLTTPEVSPFVSMLASGGVYIVACLSFGAWARLRDIEELKRRAESQCDACGYSLVGLKDVLRCPECGAPIGTAASESD